MQADKLKAVIQTVEIQKNWKGEKHHNNLYTDLSLNKPPASLSPTGSDILQDYTRPVVVFQLLQHYTTKQGDIQLYIYIYLLYIIYILKKKTPLQFRIQFRNTPNRNTSLF